VGYLDYFQFYRKDNLKRNFDRFNINLSIENIIFERVIIQNTLLGKSIKEAVL
jgi:hypothetical protein